MFPQTFRGWCGVPYYEYKSTDSSHGLAEGHESQRRKWEGHFEEQVEIDKEFGKYEKIDVPAFDDVRKSSILHDFEKVRKERIWGKQGFGNEKSAGNGCVVKMQTINLTPLPLPLPLKRKNLGGFKRGSLFFFNDCLNCCCMFN